MFLFCRRCPILPHFLSPSLFVVPTESQSFILLPYLSLLRLLIFPIFFPICRLFPPFSDLLSLFLCDLLITLLICRTMLSVVPLKFSFSISSFLSLSLCLLPTLFFHFFVAVPLVPHFIPLIISLLSFTCSFSFLLFSITFLICRTSLSVSILHSPTLLFGFPYSTRLISCLIFNSFFLHILFSFIFVSLHLYFSLFMISIIRQRFFFSFCNPSSILFWLFFLFLSGVFSPFSRVCNVLFIFPICRDEYSVF